MLCSSFRSYVRRVPFPLVISDTEYFVQNMQACKPVKEICLINYENDAVVRILEVGFRTEMVITHCFFLMITLVSTFMILTTVCFSFPSSSKDHRKVYFVSSRC